jgi:hypothetical protein
MKAIMPKYGYQLILQYLFSRLSEIIIILKWGDKRIRISSYFCTIKVMSKW